MVKKYSSVLFSNLMKSIIFFLINILIARSFGVEEYGNIIFIFFIISSIYTLLDMNSTSAMFSLYSFNRKDEILHVFFCWQGVVFLIVSLIAYIYTFEYDPQYLMYGLFVSVIVFIQQQIYVALAQISEVQGVTIKFYTKNTVLYLIFFFILVLAYVKFELTLKVYIFSYLFISVLQLYVSFQIKLFHIDWGVCKKVIISYFDYIKPLILLSLFIFANNIISRAMLQANGGGAQQANYQIALTISNSITIITASYINIFWVKLVELAKSNNSSELNKYIFKILIKSTVFASFVCCTLFPISSEILVYFFGDKYAFADITLKILLFYPIFQSSGQIYGVYLLNTNNQKTHSIISIAGILLLTSTNYLFIKFAKSFDLTSSIALALSLSLTNFISVAFQAFFVDKISGLNFKFTKFSLLTFACVLFFSTLSYFLFFFFINDQLSNFNFILIILSWIMICALIFYSTYILLNKYIVDGNRVLTQ